MKARKLWEARQAWTSFMQLKKPVRISYLSGSFLDNHFFPAINQIQKASDELLKTLGSEIKEGDPKSGYILNPGTPEMEEYIAAFNPVLEEDVDIPLVNLQFSELLAILEKVEGLTVDDMTIINIKPFFLPD